MGAEIHLAGFQEHTLATLRPVAQEKEIIAHFTNLHLQVTAE
jgi:hypothetical protein